MYTIIISVARSYSYNMHDAFQENFFKKSLFLMLNYNLVLFKILILKHSHTYLFAYFGAWMKLTLRTYWAVQKVHV